MRCGSKATRRIPADGPKPLIRFREELGIAMEQGDIDHAHDKRKHEYGQQWVGAHQHHCAAYQSFRLRFSIEFIPARIDSLGRTKPDLVVSGFRPAAITQFSTRYGRRRLNIAEAGDH
jgi:hypothetical protein